MEQGILIADEVLFAVYWGNLNAYWLSFDRVYPGLTISPLPPPPFQTKNYYSGSCQRLSGSLSQVGTYGIMVS